jgi:succinoglycan biosynthesis transport protein ExoP
MSTVPEGGSIDLAYYLDVPRRRWRVVAAAVLLGVLGAVLAIQVIPTTYTATTTLNVAPLSETLFPTGVSAADSIDLPAEIKLVESDTVALAAARALKNPQLADEIRAATNATGEPDESTLSIQYVGDSSREAIERLNALAAVYLQQREGWAKDRRRERIVQIRRQIDTLNDRLDGVLDIINEARVFERDTPKVLAARTDRKVIFGQLTELKAQRIATKNIVLQGGIITSKASPDTTVASPSRSLVLASGLALGLLVGLVLAFVRELTDRTVGREAVVSHLTGAPVLANVGQAAHHAWLSPHEEQQLQLLRSRLLAGLGSQTRVVFVVGSSPHQAGAGMARHLAESLARGGQQVSLLLIGGTGAGLEGEALSDTIEIDRVGMGVSGMELADLVQTPLVMDRIETLRIGSRFTRGHAGNDLAIVAADAPLDRASVIALARVADGVLVVVDSRVTHAEELDDVSRDIRQAGTPLLGTVMSRSKRPAEPAARPRALASR